MSIGTAFWVCFVLLFWWWVKWSERVDREEDAKKRAADYFYGKDYHVDLPVGWERDPLDVEWREFGRDIDEHTIRQALWVRTFNPIAGKEKWRPVVRNYCFDTQVSRYISMPEVDPLAREIDELGQRRRRA